MGGGAHEIVVGVDASDPARVAAEWAADLASAWAAPLRLVHVVGADDAVKPPPSWLMQLTMAAERLGATDCVADVVRGDVGRILVEPSETARLVVLGSFGRGSAGGLLTGTLGLALLEWVSCPLAVVRGPDVNLPPPRSGPVVAGVDGTSAGRAALRFAAELAGATGARLQAVHAWTELTPPSSGASHRPTEATDREADAAAVLDAELRFLRDPAPVAGRGRRAGRRDRTAGTARPRGRGARGRGRPPPRRAALRAAAGFDGMGADTPPRRTRR
jgi:nucleotide-binding universal stress UspA family protein